MSKEIKRDLIVGLDIGTSKIVAIVGEVDGEGRLSVLGMGMQESTGIKRGMVINIEATVNSISKAIAEVEMMVGCKVREVYTGIAGSHIKSKDSSGMAVVREKEVTPFDVERAIEAANATPISADDQILHTLVQEFIVDGQDGVKEPIGMDARRLDVRVHLVTGAVTAVQNIVKCVHRCGLEVVDLVLQPLASGYAVLTDDEKDVGVCLVDIGGGTTDIAVFVQGAIRHTAVIPIAGDQVTNDIAIALRTSTQDAEDIKMRFGVALQQLASAEEMIEVPGVGDRPGSQLSRQTLAGFIQPRIEEIFQQVQEELHRSGYERLLRAGIVLTGGAAQMPGMTELGEEIFHNTVKLVTPLYEGNLRDFVRNPRYSTAMGLLLEGVAQRQRGMKVQHPKTFTQVLGRMRAWFGKNF
ncbi:cell division protein FtsA [Rugosibacter aromaticivorans]|uniref:Cell division protein FtsA n=1 Tax=Rugosibacter aromaticivorans TaxID=1565605 RepID=A0A0C5J7Q0_9PROT|nr:cell division protein FtsA [Rugosibacter aromaticivorans]AJP47649.1 cell division protein FtsA [Rugosibacter aromaticivorans]TBR12826.1 MAG: cell division protein FtsA [Rugosibacter sp.]